MDAAAGFSGLPARKGRPLLERMMERVIPVPWSGCWLWTGGLYVNGYGMAFLPGGKACLAHRASMVAHGYDLKPTDVVCHHCDVKMCVNPEHLFIATQTENMADMLRKGRHTPSLKIPREMRQTIKETMRHIPTADLALKFGVSVKTIKNIRRGL